MSETTTRTALGQLAASEDTAGSKPNRSEAAVREAARKGTPKR